MTHNFPKDFSPLVLELIPGMVITMIPKQNGKLIKNLGGKKNGVSVSKYSKRKRNAKMRRKPAAEEQRRRANDY